MRLFKILLAAALYCGAVLCSSGAFTCTHILLDRPILGADVQRIQRREQKEETPQGFCFWGEAENQLVFCRETGGTAVVTQTLLAGNPGLMDAPILSWREGCLLDEKTARTLFGTAAVGQQILWHGDSAYPVLGTVDTPRPTMVLTAGPEDALARLVLPLHPEEGSVTGPQCLLRWGIAGKVLDTALLWSLSRNLLLVFPAVLLGRCTKRAGRLRWVPIALLLWQFAVIPAGMIPSRWSDFSFWGRWWEREAENALALLAAPLGNSRLQMMLNMVKSVVMNLAACLLLIRSAPNADLAD